MQLHQIEQVISHINRSIGRTFAWLVLVMVIMMFVNVVTRYVFNATLIWQQELVRFMHAILFLSAVGYTLLDEKHVRVDVFYQHFSPKTQALVNLCGTILFLIPTSIALFYFSYDFVLNSWRIFESSPEYLGMPGVFILKTFVWVFAGSLLLQGVAVLCRSINTLQETT